MARQRQTSSQPHDLFRSKVGTVPAAIPTAMGAPIHTHHQRITLTPVFGSASP